MSYGVLASKPAEVRVAPVPPAGSPAEPSGPWGAGRLTLTSLHLTFVPLRTSPDVPALTLALADILKVESGSGRSRRTVSFHTARVVLHVRVTGAAAFARRVETSVEASRRRGASGSAPVSEQPLAGPQLRSEL